jgi:hypothetical protein
MVDFSELDLKWKILIIIGFLSSILLVFAMCIIIFINYTSFDVEHYDKINLEKYDEIIMTKEEEKEDAHHVKEQSSAVKELVEKEEDAVEERKEALE